jgi:hypothetical protein
MSKDRNRWKRIQEEGAEWEARVIASPAQTEAVPGDGDELLEFVCVDGSRKARQLAVAAGSYESMDEEALHRAFVRARPIGGDHYGRPGKPTNDAP